VMTFPGNLRTSTSQTGYFDHSKQINKRRGLRLKLQLSPGTESRDREHEWKAAQYEPYLGYDFPISH
jgi:hypothetical protein